MLNSTVKRILNITTKSPKINLVYRNQYYLRNISSLSNNSSRILNNKNVNCGKVRYNNTSSQGRQQTSPTEETIRNHYAIGPFTWKSLVLFLVTGAGLFIYFRNEKKKVLEKRKEELATKSIGKSKVGGPFELINQDGKLVTDKDFLGKFLLVYFGFTHCPDICPEELDKISKVTDTINNDEEIGGGKVITPIFISCDPERDSVEVVRMYLKDFHKDMVGLTGSFEQVSKAAKSYRVYFSKPPQLQPGDEYLVDHSIFFYLMDPDGEFVDAYGKNLDAEQVSSSIRRHVKDFLKRGGVVRKDN